MAEGPPPPLVTAAVVNWNGGKTIGACLRSLLAQDGIAIDPIVIDNASTDDSVERARSDFPQVDLIENPTNRGYGPALNQAIERMKGEYFLALNTDIRLEAECVAALVRCIERRAGERCGYAQGKVLLMTADGEPTGRIYSTGHLFPRGRMVYNRGHGQIDQGQYDREEAIPGANGACVLMTRAMIDDLRAAGGRVFDPLFFLYGNDADMDWAAARIGWTCWYCPEAVSHHQGEGSSGVTSRGFDAPFVNVRFLMMLKNERFRDLLIDLPFILKGNLIDLAPKLLRKPSLLFSIPWDLLRMLGPALASRRRTRDLRRKGAFNARQWLRRSSRLLRASRRFG